MLLDQLRLTTGQRTRKARLGFLTLGPTSEPSLFKVTAGWPIGPQLGLICFASTFGKAADEAADPQSFVLYRLEGWWARLDEVFCQGPLTPRRAAALARSAISPMTLNAFGPSPLEFVVIRSYWTTDIDYAGR